LQIGQTNEAFDAAWRAAACNPSFSIPQLLQTAALVRLGRDEEAKAAAQRVLKLDPTFSIRKYSVVNGHVPAVFAPLAEAWRAAGLPEKVTVLRNVSERSNVPGQFLIAHAKCRGVMAMRPTV
jgi:hypothetical protein